MTLTSFEVSGPLVQKDAKAVFWANIRKAMQALATEGEQEARDAFRATESSRAPISLLGDHVSDHVVGRVVSLVGKEWRASAVVSINNSGLSQAQGISLMAAASLVEGRTHVMHDLARRTAKAIRQIDLTAGLE